MASPFRIFLGLALCFSLTVTEATPVVQAPWGQIQGIFEVTDNWSPYHVYYSIPYALPPVGSRRFQKPVQHPGVHNGVFNATTRGPSCLQPKQFASDTNFSEDCLTLDVYTPVIDQSPSYAVIVYIHGGGFLVGGPLSSQGGYLASKDVVVVMIRYRLGPFGFLSTDDDASKGNYGLWDQHMALQWVQRNIRAFGGDPNMVTLMGQSAGSASVAYHALYDGSKGLFQRTLMQSGAATSTWALNRNPVKTTYELAKKIGCTASEADHLGIVNCLRAAPASAFPNASWPVGNDLMTALTSYYFVPTVDGEFVKEEPLTLMNNHKYLQDVGFLSRDSLVSFNSNEGSILLESANMTDEAFGSSMGTALTNRTFYRNSLIPKLLDIYFGSSTPHMADIVDYELTYPNTTTSSVNLKDVVDTFADPAIDVPTISYAVTLSELKSNQSNFMYLFDHYPSFLPPLTPPLKGADHGMDLMYVFDVGRYNITDNPSERKISDLLIGILTDFAKTGDPRPAVKQFTGVTWPEFTSSDQKYLDLKVNPEIRSHPYRKRFELWTQLLPEMLRNRTSVQQGKAMDQISFVG